MSTNKYINTAYPHDTDPCPGKAHRAGLCMSCYHNILRASVWNRIKGARSRLPEDTFIEYSKEGALIGNGIKDLSYVPGEIWTRTDDC
jgi:hypothetical protein